MLTLSFAASPKLYVASGASTFNNLTVKIRLPFNTWYVSPPITRMTVVLFCAIADAICNIKQGTKINSFIAFITQNYYEFFTIKNL
ncbi:MAG: hypothetical protein ACOVO1_11635 [Chitinophagaceae bacterium]